MFRFCAIWFFLSSVCFAGTISGGAITGTATLQFTSATIYGSGAFTLAGAPLHSTWFDTTPNPAVFYRPAGTGVPIVINDAIYTSTSGSFYTDYFWPYTFPDGQSGTVTRSTTNSAVIIPSSSDPSMWTWLSNGTATIQMSTADRTLSKTVTTATSSLSGRVLLTAYSADSLRYAIDSAIDSALASKSHSNSNHVFRFIPYDPNTFTVTANSQFWGASFDLSCAPAMSYAHGSSGAYYSYPGYSGYGCGVLVSPRHVVAAYHNQNLDLYNFQAPGHVYYFRGTSGTVYTRTVTAVVRPLPNHPDGALLNPNTFPDLMVLALDSDLPSDVVPAKVLPSNWRNYLPSDGFAVMVVGGFNDPFVHEERVEQAGYSGFAESMQAPINAKRAEFWRYGQHGDSSSPHLIFINGTTVVVTVESSNGGGSIARYASDINAAMTTLGGGYQLTTVDLSGFPSY